MTTLTIEIDENKDFSALTEFINQLGFTYHVEEDEVLLYNSELKNMLDKRYADYKNGETKLISPEESKQSIQELFANKNHGL